MKTRKPKRDNDVGQEMESNIGAGAEERDDKSAHIHQPHQNRLRQRIRVFHEELKGRCEDQEWNHVDQNTFHDLKAHGGSMKVKDETVWHSFS